MKSNRKVLYAVTSCMVMASSVTMPEEIFAKESHQTMPSISTKSITKQTPHFSELKVELDNLSTGRISGVSTPHDLITVQIDGKTYSKNATFDGSFLISGIHLMNARTSGTVTSRDNQDSTTVDVKDAATPLVNSLFEDSPANKVLKNNVAQTDIDNVRNKISVLLSATLKEKLNNELTKAESLLEIMENGRKAVAALFTDANQNEIIYDLTIEDILAAEEKVKVITNNTEKNNLLGQTELAKKLLEDKQQTVEFSDNNLKKAVQEALDLNPDEAVTIYKMETLTSLNAEQKSIKSLEGLQYAERLTTLDLSGNNILDFSPLKGIKSLSSLNAENQEYVAEKLTGLNGDLKAMIPLLKGKNGEKIETATNISNGGVFEATTKEVTWANIPEGEGDVSYQMEKSYGGSNKISVNVKQPYEMSFAGSGEVTPDEYVLGRNTITGSYIGEVRHGEVFINGIGQGKGGTFQNGKFTAYIHPSAIKITDDVEYAIYDAKGNELDRKKVETTNGSVTPDEYTLGTNSITGSYTGNVRRGEIIINGISRGMGGNFQNGNFSFYISPGVIKRGDAVEFVGYESGGKEIARAVVNIEE
ncbi:leucine-rich repeat domain-containing protein [Listeria grandensis]|uniref:Leucine-rich repeat domain-containing protein n=1 Tax=Listeria grandensis TaxID=1494963 RepID=A0A7X0Y2N2_9LIST|nr:immunoglobulin-like domain-containing protein [Listeria grandensis]MBC1935871.1 leucine-rich repeat domain-containing protein [Listeria grandensis]